MAVALEGSGVVVAGEWRWAVAVAVYGPAYLDKQRLAFFSLQVHESIRFVILFSFILCQLSLILIICRSFHANTHIVCFAILKK